MAGFSLMIVYNQHNSSKQSEAKMVDRDLEGINDFDKSTRNKFSEQKNGIQKGKLHEDAAKESIPEDEVKSEKIRIKRKKQTKKKKKQKRARAVHLGWNLTGRIKHDRTAFTQGLEIEDGIMYETTGLYGGRSSLRRIDMETGQVLKAVPLGNEYFGEGMTIWGDNIIVLTWKKQTGFIFDKETFEKKGTFPFETENGQGWGLTHDNKQLIVSDGTEYVFFWDPHTFEEQRRIKVTRNGRPVRKVNELEYVKMDDGKGVILANIWYEDDIIAINPKNGNVIAVYDMHELLEKKDVYGGEDCLNGIAYDKASGLMYLTGKLYGYYYKTRLENIDEKRGHDL
jgi:glutamine cyclotransferase